MSDLGRKKIMFSGGGSGGPVMPLLAVAEELLRDGDQTAPELIFVGTQSGPEREMVEAFNVSLKSVNGSAVAMEFVSLLSGKWRRYFSLSNFFDIFKIIIAYFQSCHILMSRRPDLVVTAGAFVSVPLVWAAGSLKIPVLIHQQDVRPGLANKLMAPCARVISVTFEKSLADYGSRAVWLGNPFKNLSETDLADRTGMVREKYSLTGDKSLVVIMGGATGSAVINKLSGAAAAELGKFCQVVHLTGRGKTPSFYGLSERLGYSPLEFVDNDELLSLLSLAEVVVSRCGLSALTELSALNKAAILIPMPASHQEDNAAIFAKAKAALVLSQNELTPEKLTVEIRRVLTDRNLREELQKNIGKVIKRGATATMAGIIWEMVK